MMSVDYDARYCKGWAYGKEPSQWLKAAAAEHLPLGATGDFGSGCVLSLGEGQGRNAAHLAALGHHVTAVDASRVLE
jgi:SAM-dependent methyltransferase